MEDSPRCLSQSARDQRRQAAFKQNLSSHEEAECELRRKISTGKMLKTSVKEKCVSGQLLKHRLDKMLFKMNVVEQIATFEDERKQELLTALEFEQEISSTYKILCAMSLEKKNILHNVLSHENKKINYNKHFLVCKRLVDDIIDLSIAYYELKDLHNGNIPKSVYNEKLDLFLCEIKLFPQGITCDDYFKFVNQLEFNYYLNMENTWKCSNATIKSSNLNIILSQLFEIAHSDNSKDFYQPHFPKFSLRVCILGGPHSGKSICCQKLSSIFKLQIISVPDAVNEALEAFKSSESMPFESEDKSCHQLAMSEIENGLRENAEEAFGRNNVTEKLTKRAELGKQAFENLKRGCTINDDVVVEIIAEYIRRIPEDGSGWIMDGFPQTMKQLELLERALTGWDNVQSKKKSFQSRIIPTIQKENKNFRSGIDVVLVIDVPDDVIINRSHVLQGSNNLINGQVDDNMKVLQRMKLYKEEICNIIGWFTSFSRLRCLNGCEDIVKAGVKYLNDTMIELSLLNTEIRKHLEENPVKLLPELQTNEGRDEMGFNVQINKAPISLNLSKESSELILDFWYKLEDDYIRGCCCALMWLRSDCHKMIAHFSKIRKDFKRMLGGPDCMQICLLQFQKEINSFPSMLRNNKSVKSELCQKVDDLQIKLWKMADEKRKKLEMQTCLFSSDQYFTFCLSSVNNHLIQLIYHEMSKLENVLNLLKDTYCYCKGSSDTVSFTFEHKTLFKALNNEEIQQKSSSAKKQTEIDEKRSKFKPEKENELPLISGISDILLSSRQFFSKMNEIITTLNDCSNKESISLSKESKKKLQAPDKISTQQLIDDDKSFGDQEALLNELCICMKSEIDCTMAQIDVIENVALKYAEEIQNTLNNMLNVFKKWIGTNYLLEMQTIDLTCEVARNCLEHGHPISDLLNIESGNLFMDESFSVPALFQKYDATNSFLPSCSMFSLHQLFGVFHRFMGTAPTGLIPKEIFHDLLQQIASDCGLPDFCMKNLSKRVENAACTIEYEEGYVNWKKFLLLLADPLWPTEEDILVALDEFHKFDQLLTGQISKEQFMKSFIWLDKTRVFIKEFIFLLFACHQNIPAILDYGACILSFCLHEDSKKGLELALKIASVIEDAMTSFSSSPNNSKNKNTISGHMLYKVLYPLQLMGNQGSRLYYKECKMAEILYIYKNLGAKTIGERLPIMALTEGESWKTIARNSHKFGLNYSFSS